MALEDPPLKHLFNGDFLATLDYQYNGTPPCVVSCVVSSRLEVGVQLFGIQDEEMKGDAGRWSSRLRLRKWISKVKVFPSEKKRNFTDLTIKQCERCCFNHRNMEKERGLSIKKGIQSPQLGSCFLKPWADR